MESGFGRLIEEYRRSDFVRNAFHLVSGTAIAQLIPILLQPVLRRIYTPADFGAFAIYFNIVSILAVVLTLRYEQGVVIAASDKEAVNTLGLATLSSIILTSVVAAILLLFFDELKSLVGFPQTHIRWLYLLPLSAFLYSFYDILNYWLIRKKAFKSSAVNKISRRSVEGVLQLFLGFKKNTFGLFIGDILGNTSNVISAIFQTKKKELSLGSVSREGLNHSMRRFSEFPKYNLIPTFLNALSLAFPLFLIGKFYNPVEVGYVDLSRQVLAIPLALISITIGQVLLQRISEKKNSQFSIYKDMRQLFLLLTSVAVIEIIIILLFGEFLFGFVFGKSWNVSGEYSKILVISYAVKFVMTTLSIAFIALEKVRLIAAWQAGYFLAILVLIFFRNVPVSKFLFIYAFIEVLAYTLYFFLLVRTINQYEKKLSILD